MAIPPIFDQPGAGFVLLGAGIKFPSLRDEWQKPENAYSFQEADLHATKGGNVGALAGIGPYIGLDKDDPSAFEGITLPASTTWETRPGRLGMRFICHDRTPELLAKYGKPADHAQFKLYDGRRVVDGKHPAVGEVKLERTYQVIPPSHKFIDPATGDDVPPGKGDRVDYKLLESKPPAEIPLERLLSELLRIGLVFSETPKAKAKLEANTQKLEAIKKNASNKQKDKKAKALQFFKRALQRAEVGNRNDTGLWLVCQLRDLGLSEAEASGFMRLYARAVPEGGNTYTEEDAQKSLEQAYARAPREPPKSEERRAEEANGNGNGDKLAIEMFTKVTGRKKIIDPETGKFTTDPETGEPDEPKISLSPSKAATTVLEKMDLSISEKDAGDKAKIWHYNSIWKPDGERQIIATIDKVLGDLSYEKGLRETLRRVRSMATMVAFDSNPYLFPAKDGVVELETGIFRPAKPDDHLTFQYNVNINEPNADYKQFLWFLCSSLPDPRDVVTVLDIITAIAIRVPFEVIVLLFGGGSNGKGILEKVILALFTMSRATAIKLEEMKRSRFGPGALLNKDVWIVTEVETVKDAMSVLKAEATGEFIDSDMKYGERMQGMPHALPILDANNAFDFGDNSYGRKRRMAKIDFPYTFGDEPGMRPKDGRLEEKLKRPEVLAGIAQIIRARAPALVRSRRIYRRKGTEEQEDEFRRQQFHLNTFCEDCLSVTWPYDVKEYGNQPPERLKVDAVYSEYLEYCKLFNATVPASKVEFGRYIAKKFDKISSHTTDREASYRYYPGLYQIKSAKTLYAEVKQSFYYTDDRSTTDIRQIYDRYTTEKTLTVSLLGQIGQTK